jgi:hypothetical protein
MWWDWEGETWGRGVNLNRGLGTGPFSHTPILPVPSPLRPSWARPPANGSSLPVPTPTSNGAFTLEVNSVLNKNLGGILGGTQCEMGDGLMLSEC